MAGGKEKGKHEVGSAVMIAKWDEKGGGGQGQTGKGTDSSTGAVCAVLLKQRRVTCLNYSLGKLSLR